jgi:tetratricopeptide (TPR) repeat protein
MNVAPHYVRTPCSPVPDATDCRTILARLCALLTLTSLLSLPIMASADYRVSAYKGTPGYNQIMTEQYTQAAAVAASRTAYAPQYALAANLCVSELKRDALTAALKSCTRALNSVSSYRSATFTPQDRRKGTSEMLSNRGVVLALQGSVEAAENDFTRALDLDPDNANAIQNLKYLRSNLLASSNSAD